MMPARREFLLSAAAILGCTFVNRTAEDPAVTDQMWIDAASTQFDGRIIVGKDLLEI